MSALPTAEQIRTEGQSKLRIVKIDSWVAAHLSDVWQDMANEIRKSITSETKGKKDSSHTSLSTLASAHSQS